jgi:hypothetical protein
VLTDDVDAVLVTNLAFGIPSPVITFI